MLAAMLAASACASPPLPDVPPPGTVRPQPRPREVEHVDHLDGRVVDDQGHSLAGATVWFGGLPFQETDAEGRFRIQLRGWDRQHKQQNLRVSASGFRPLTKDVSAGRPFALMLQRDPEAAWHPPACSLRRALPWWPRHNDTMMWGYTAAFRFPRGTEVSLTGGDHGSSETICRSEECLYRTSANWEAYTGIEVGIGFMDVYKEVRERDVHWDSEVQGAEYRGVLYDGTFSRSVLMVGQDRISYHRVSKASAAYFDAIIDSMCWIDRE